MIWIYNILNILLIPIYLIFSILRILSKKDNISSILQRFAISYPPRPEGELIWIHAASVGESLVAMTLVKMISEKHPDYSFLITTTTLSSAKIIKKQAPSNVMHQFVPLDNILIVCKFLNHWTPTLGIFIESELWPCLISEASEDMELLLVNARLSDSSYHKWKNQKYIFQQITDSFNKIIAQSELDMQKFEALGCSKVSNGGNLKFLNDKLIIKESLFEDLRTIFADKPVVVFASTHPEDEKVILAMIKQIRKDGLFYPILIPRHPKRKEEIIAQCKKLSIKPALRSKNIKSFNKYDLFIVDSFAETGVFYRLAQIVFVGGSFANGGHNPIEPAAFNNAILFGPDMSNFAEISRNMIESNSAIIVQNSEELKNQITRLLTHESELAKYSSKSYKYVTLQKKSLENYLEHIKEFL